jgi:hypothetical protein
MAFFNVTASTTVADLEAFVEGGGDLSLQNDKGNTALMLACLRKNANVALKILEFTPEQNNLGAQNNNVDTALTITCYRKLENVALKILDFTPEQNNLCSQTSTDDTALIIACGYLLKNVALKILEFTPEQNNLGAQNKLEITALMMACDKNLENVALKMLDFTPEQNNLSAQAKFGKTALDYAKEKGLQNVVKKINAIMDSDKIRFINITKTIENYDPIMMETEKITIHKYIAESHDNIVFRYGNGNESGTEYKYFFTKMSYIMNNQDSNILYPCKTASGVIGDNYLLDKPLYNVKGIGLLIDPVYFKTIVENKNGQLFVIEETGKTVPSVVSKSVVEGGTWVSSAHCQEGQGTKVNTVYVATPSLEDLADKDVVPEDDDSETVATGSGAAASGGGKQKKRTRRKMKKRKKSSTSTSAKKRKNKSTRRKRR